MGGAACRAHCSTEVARLLRAPWPRRTATNYLPYWQHIWAAAKVTTALTRLEQGNTSKVKGLGSGVFELKIDFGPRYRVYFGKDGPEIVILLGGGSKKKLQRDIDDAHVCWHDYKDRKKGSA